LSEKLGKSRSHIANTVRLLTLPEIVINSINNGQLSMGHGRAILGIKNKKHIDKVVNKTIKENLTVSQIEKLKLELNEGKTAKKSEIEEKDKLIVKQKTH